MSQIPAALRAANNWLVWRLTQTPGEKKPRKIPFYVSGGARSGNGTDEDRALLASYERAVRVADDYSGLGFALLPDSGIIALDFDDVVVDGRVDPRVLAVVAGTYAEFSPSGRGVRAFFKGTRTSCKSLDVEPKVEVFGDSGYVTVTGRQLPEHEMCGWDDVVDLTPAALEFVVERFGSSRDIDLFATLKPALDIDAAQIQEVLDALPADLHYDDWLKVGMGLHHQGCDFEVWHAWSQKSPKYTTRDYCEKRWGSFGGGRLSITFAYAIKLAGIKLQKQAADSAKTLQHEIAQVTDVFELRTRVADLIRKDDRLQDFDREMLAQALRERFAALGMKLPIGEVRKLITPRREARAEGLPEWAQEWIYVTTEDKFLRMGTEVTVTRSGFDAQFSRLMPRGDNGEVVKQASAACLEDFDMPTVDRALYVPWADMLFEYEGQACVNRYKPDSAPAAAPSSAGAEAPMVEHLMNICGRRQDVVDELVCWMAYCVQNPGRKIRWAPLIKGVEGDGKSLIGDLMGAVMGNRNVKVIAPQVLHTDFTGWAEGSCVAVLEEIKLTGHNRYDVLNKLKPYITNDKIDIHRKGKDPYNTHNTQNYAAFTNHNDSLPLSDTDRRWFVIFTPWADRAELATIVGDTATYFKRLFDLVHSEPAKLRRWLLDVDVSKFEPNSPPLQTAEKAEMVALSVTDEEDTVREVIAAGGLGIGQEVLSSSCLTQALRFAGIDLKTTNTNRMLDRAGWSKVPSQVKWRGLPHRVWVSKRANLQKSADWMRSCLEKTVPSDGVGDLF